MKNTNRFSKLEKGQVLPLVVVVVLALVAFAALLIDGGSIMLNRRTAQAAADAGAMAGARELCSASGASPLDVARNYALMNGAESANVQIVNGSVAVTTSVTNDSFFAKIFNENTLEAGAEAIAGCFSPGGKYLMPIAWSCRPSLGDTAPFDPGLDCKMMALDWPGLLGPLVGGNVSTIEIPGNDGSYKMDGNNIIHSDTGKPPKQIYIIMDKIASNQDTFCKEDLDPSDPAYDLAITCDVDGDGKKDIEGAGNRGWLDLDNGGGGAAQMKDWIRYGTNFTVYPHTWLSGQPGAVTSVYQAIRDYREGDVVWIPVFNAICDDRYPTSNSACMNAAHANPFPPEPASGDIDLAGSAPKFHVIAFDAFYISCVHIQSSDRCPGFTLAQEMNPDPSNPKKSLIPDNTSTVEGFFLTNVDATLDPNQNCDVNLGNCLVSLTK